MTFEAQSNTHGQAVINNDTASMASTASSTNPRRRPAGTLSPDNLVDAFSGMSLQKGATVHAGNNTTSDLLDPLNSARDGSPANPLRSPTCPQSLEQLLVSAGERRAQDLLARVDQAIATQSKLAYESALNEPDILPVTAQEKEFKVKDEDENTDDEDTQTEVRTRTRSHSHSSDSGIGSSVESLSGKSARTVDGLTKAAATSSLEVIEERGLSEHAKDQISKLVIKPILQEQSLTEFHPLVEDVPRRIETKEIKTLRGLERSLIFAAPEYTHSPRKYLQFCERTLRVLHTTVTTLHESDQRAPTDRPYTQGYFVDLVEQIRRYARLLAIAREKQAKGEKLDEMDYSPGESVSLQGGVSHNGKQAELVRHKDGKVISIATGKTLTPEELAEASERPMLDAGDDLNDEVLRSMARRKKNAKPEIHECSLCDKEFKRPCDLTKHVKTHERPWKCPEADCKYHDLGWPTEKERDRHVNDKHSDAPSLYHCLFKPCPYTSKRESNCKQHMEKAHGWVYVRSKNNGKSRASDASRVPFGSVPPSPSSAMLTPHTPIAPSPSIHSWTTSSRHDSLAPSAGPSNYGTPAFAQPSPDFASHFNMNFDFNDISDNFALTSAFPMTPALSEDRRTSMSTASSHGLVLDGSTYHEAFTPDDLDFATNFDFSMNYPQQPTPNSAIGMPSNSKPDDVQNFAGPSSAYLSPHASADMAFISPHPSFDNMDMADDSSNANEDFTLFSNANVRQPAPASAEMFPSLSEGQGWSNFGTQFDINAPAQFKSDNSALNELFPELSNQL